MTKWLSLVLMVCSLGSLFAFQPQSSFSVWESAEGDATWLAPDDITIKRAQPIVIQPDFMEIVTHARWQLEFWPEFLDLNLFPDVNAKVRLDSAYESKTGGLVLKGTILDQPLGQFHAVIHRQVVIMNIQLEDGMFQVRYAGNQLHQVLEIDQSKFLPDAEPGEVSLRGQIEPALPPAPAGAGNTVVDVMVVYTEVAKNQEGSVAAMEALIDLAVAETNTSYQNSNIQMDINLIHQQQIDYTESSSMALDRNRLQSQGDGFMDDVHGLRTQYGADIVVLVRGSLGGSCGIAYIMNSVTPDFRDFGFCVVSRTCATGYYSFGHELGHIMSARHDWYVDNTNNAPFTFNHAYVNTVDRWRTVMGYNRNCSDQGFSCPRLIYWSNPDVVYQGAPMGVPEGQSQPSFNAKTLNNTATTVAAFMESIVCEEDGYEPNNALAPNQILTATVAGKTYPDLQICPSDPDIFTVDVEAGHSLDVSIAFSHANGDLSLRLYSEAGVEITASTSSDDDEALSAPIENSAKRYYVEITGEAAATNTYSLTLKKEPGMDQIYEYWMSDTVTMCSNGPATVINLLCYMDNGFECPPTVCE